MEAHPESGAPASELTSRLARLTGLRLALLLVIFGAIASFHLRGELDHYPDTQRVLLTAMGAAFALAATSAALLRGGRFLRSIGYAQLVADQLTWTAFVYVSGGVASGATSLYGLTCVIGAVLLGLRGALVGAAAALAAYGSLCVALASGWLAPPLDQPQAGYAREAATMLYPALVNGLGVFVVALLAGYLAERLVRTGGALAAATERAKAAERLALLGRIAAGLAHEIRNPLSAMSGSLELLGESAATSSDDRRLVEIIQREAKRLDALVSDMLDLSRQRAPHLTECDFVRMVREVGELAATGLLRAAGDVGIVIDAPDAPLSARCDGEQMRQVLWNLLRNAVQVTPAGERVELACSREGGRLVVEVRDRGPGIPEELSDQMFAEGFTTRSKGAGLGLAVVKRIIDDHASLGADLRVLRREGGGAVFRVSLPLTTTQA